MKGMKIPHEAAQKYIWEALFKHDGDREKAAAEMGVSIRTFYRYLRDFDMHPLLDKVGWTAHAGPPRGQPRGSSIVREQILTHIRKNGGSISFGALAVEIYGVDTPTMRQRIYSALEDMKKRGRIDHADDVWKILPVSSHR